MDEAPRRKGRQLAASVLGLSAERLSAASPDRALGSLLESFGVAHGFVLHLGEQRLDLGGGVSIAPISDLWTE